MRKKALILFMRYPEMGTVKTRIAGVVGEKEACRVYKMLLGRTLGIVSDFKQQNPEVDIFLCVEPPEKIHDTELAYPGNWRTLPQQGTHLGSRMENAFGSLFSLGYDQVLLTGSDIVDVETEDFREAFNILGKGHAVLGPATDGGFYLIGLNGACPAAFENTLWGTSEILLRTEQKLINTGFQVGRIKIRRDVDESHDLHAFYNSPDFRRKLSVIVPTLNSINTLRSVIHRWTTQLWPDDEIIIVQGKDGEDWDFSGMDSRVRIVTSRKGRGVQMNRGAELATGDIFLFLHDDSRPPPQFAYLVRQIGKLPEISIGCFQLGFIPSSPGLDRIARWANLRTLWFKLPYGDQGIFCRRSVFQQLGGFRRQLLMEDVDFVRRGGKKGKLMILPHKLYTSPRRYLSKGILRASLENHIIMMLYHMGATDSKLYSMYYGK